MKPSLARLSSPQTPAPGAKLSVAKLTVAGEALWADLSGALWHEDSLTLVVSDLHFEKGSAFAQKGILLPPYDTRATLARLSELIVRFRPRRLVSLGDSFHDLGADGRMHLDDERRLAHLIASVEDWIWIEGNHDPAPPTRFGGQRREVLHIGALRLRHDPLPGPQVGEIAGHLHPCAKVRASGRAVRRRCFVSDGSRLILPAFGAYTGGLNIRDQAFAACFKEAPRAYVMGKDQMYPIAYARCVGD
ncbi:ligase-associated DNA damage response endonuclease PdeM [Woodsholea maritima]|uniref:ligase-associated DNA damage response endonuclease PdeM n=1 Tax=Woodsholea maritima TaxID=240237 RepID=UPI000372B2F3|nr:ligase-associated DNA damage response endonuclease PdeM [Woodsholea maritima]